MDEIRSAILWTAILTSGLSDSRVYRGLPMCQSYSSETILKQIIGSALVLSLFGKPIKYSHLFTAFQPLLCCARLSHVFQHLLTSKDRGIEPVNPLCGQHFLISNCIIYLLYGMNILYAILIGIAVQKQNLPAFTFFSICRKPSDF